MLITVRHDVLCDHRNCVRSHRSTDIPTLRSETWKRADFQSSTRLGIDVVLSLEIFPNQERPRLVYTLWEVLALNGRKHRPLSDQKNRLHGVRQVTGRELTAERESPMNWKASSEGL